MNGSGCKTCPAKDECRAQLYRGEMCKDNRAEYGLGDPRTNGDRIRAMSDEEIAEAIYHGISSDACDYCKENDHHCTGHTCQGKAGKEVILEWLQQPAEVQKDD